MKRGLFVAAIAAVAALPLCAEQNHQPTLVIEKNRITASGFTPGAAVIAFTVASVHVRYDNVRRVGALRHVDTDKDGTVVFEFIDPIPSRSIWIAVDEQRGDFAIAAPAVFDLRKGSPIALRKHNQLVDEISWPSHAAYLLYVHPGLGAWTGYANDAAPGDGQAAGSFIASFPLDQLQPLYKGNDNHPKEIKPGGTLFIVDAFDLTVTATRVDGAMIGAAK